MSEGKLYIVATPIGNFADITARAVEVLTTVDCIAVEDTRHSARLLAHLNLSGKHLIACHDHNESQTTDTLVKLLLEGKRIALVSDAGTPLVSDPGYRLVCQAVASNITVVPVPGACSVIAALSVAALPTDRFCFEGFLPAKGAQRRSRLSELEDEPRTLVLLEAPHRIHDLVTDVATVMGRSRRLTIARELTKTYEQIWHGTAEEAQEQLGAGGIPAKGEFVVVLAGNPDASVNADEKRVMQILLAELPPAAAANVGSQILGVSRKHLYEVALSLKNS